MQKSWVFENLGLDSAVRRRHFAFGVVVVWDFCSIGEDKQVRRLLKVMIGERVSESVRLFACSNVEETLKERTRLVIARLSRNRICGRLVIEP